MLEKMVKVVSLNPSGITILPDRMRRLRPEVIDELAESIKQQGLLQPIVVRTRPRGGLGYILVAGWHRLMAIRKLGRDSIRASVLDGINADRAELAEIDENLIRADLTPSERAMHIGRRKKLYEKEHPETRHGGAPGKAGGGKKAKGAKSASFAEHTAAATGQSKRKVALDAQRAKDCVVLDAIADTSLDKGDEIDALCKLPAKEQRALASRAKAGEKVSAKVRLKQIKREEKEQELADKQLALPTQKYGVIVCDDAWNFEPWSRETGMDRHAANHYVVEDANTAQEMHEATKDRFECAADDCLLAMWTTVPHLAIAIDLLRLRGFRYVSNYVWGKDKAGTGHWNRNKHEILLLGVRGKVPCPAPGKQWESLIMAPVGRHSAKPETFLQMIEEYYPNLRKIELNRRGKSRDGWDAWGAEAVQEAAE